MERPRHAGGVAIEPSLEVVQRHAHDRVAVSHRSFLLSHARTIAAVHHAANSTATQEPAEPEPDRTCGWVY
jgi:hypothetical protein